MKTFVRMVAVLLQLCFEAFEQRERIGRAAGETRDDRAVVQSPDFTRIALHDGIAERNLAVATHGDAAVATDAEDRGAVGVEHGEGDRG